MRRWGVQLFISHIIQCPCANGACMVDPCATITCNMPPAPSCPDGNTRRVRAGMGSCAGGSCTYTESDDPCPYGCANGVCKPNPCQGIMCNSQRTPTCAGVLKRTYGAAGTCGNGACIYPCTDTACPASQTCGGSGMPGVCGCTPESPAVTCLNKLCGTAQNNCGLTVSCTNQCGPTQVCGGGTAGPNGCCTPQSVATTCQKVALPPACESVAVENNCGQIVSCDGPCNGCCYNLTIGGGLVIGRRCCPHGGNCGDGLCP